MKQYKRSKNLFLNKICRGKIAEDRQAAAKQGADTRELISHFTEQVERFKILEPSVRKQMCESIHTAISNNAKIVGEEMNKAATQATAKITNDLNIATQHAENVLNRYQTEVATTQWKVIGVSVVTTIITCLLLVWLIMPKPTLPLTNEQLRYIGAGMCVFHSKTITHFTLFRSPISLHCDH